MNILFLANHFNAGGITSYVLTLTRAFVRDGHRVIVASAGGDMVADLQSAGARHVRFPFQVKSEIHPVLFWQAPSVSRFVAEEGVQILHAQTRVTQMMSALVSRRTGVPFLSTCHGFFKPHWGRRVLPLLGGRVIAISRPVQDHLIHDLATPRDKIVLVPNGIDLSLFDPVEAQARQALRDMWGLGDGPVIGSIARLSDVKGHSYLLNAMPGVLSRYPALKCLLFGQGPLEAELKAMVASKGLQKSVFFYPMTGRPAQVLPLMDIFVMPSVQEGLGLSVLEAAAMGIPCVASRIGGLQDAVDDRETGILVKSRDPDALADGLIELLSDPARVRTMGAKARCRVEARFSAPMMAEGTMAVYRDVLKDGL